MPTTLDPEIIEAVHAHLQADGSRKIKDLALITGDNTKEVNTAYVAAVAEKYPKSYEKEEPAPVETVYKLLNKDGILQTLSVVTSKPGKLILEIEVPPEPKDEVTILLKGKSETIDLFQLRKQGAQSPFEGVSVQSLLMLGEMAKG